MNRQPQETEMTGSEHTPLSRNRRRLAAKTGAAMFAGAVLALGMTTPAAGAPQPSLPRYLPLADNCGSGFTGSFSWSDGTTQDTITVKYTPPAGYVAPSDIDVRGTVTSKDKDGRERSRTIRLKEEYDPTAAGTTTKTFTAPANVEIWRVGVGAMDAAGVEIHALDSEAGPCE